MAATTTTNEEEIGDDDELRMQPEQRYSSLSSQPPSSPRLAVEEQRLIEWTETVNVLTECTELIGKRKRAVQDELQQALDQEKELVQKIQAMHERIEYLTMNKERQLKLLKGLRRNLSKSRERLATSILVDYPNIVAAGLRRNPNFSLSENNNNSKNIKYNSYQDDIKALLEASAREMLTLDAAAAVNTNRNSSSSTKPKRQSSSHRLLAMRGTCLDLRIMATMNDRTEEGSLPAGTNEQSQQHQKCIDAEHDAEHDASDPDSYEDGACFDPNVPVCPFELNGVCFDPYCRFQHLSNTRPTAKILPPESVPLPKLNLPPISVPERRRGSGSDTLVCPNNSAMEKSRDLPTNDVGEGFTVASSAASVDPMPGITLERKVSQEHASMDAIFSLDYLLSNYIVNHAIDQTNPFNGSVAAIQATIEYLQLAIHSGRLAMPKSWTECADMAVQIFTTAAGTTAALATESVDGGVACNHAEILRYQIKEKWGQVQRAHAQQQLQGAPHDEGNIFSRAFMLQRTLRSVSLSLQGSGKDYEDGLYIANTPPSTIIPRDASIREIIEIHLPLAVSHSWQQQQNLYQDYGTEQYRVWFCNNTAVLLGEAILASLERAATVISSKKKQQTDRRSSQSVLLQRDCVELFNAISKVIADLIAVAHDRRMRATTASIAGFPSLLSHTMLHHQQHDHHQQQLILAPVCAAHLSLGCFIRQYDVVQLRIEWLMNISSSFSVHGGGGEVKNLFLCSELLWSQLIQLQLCLPFFSQDVSNNHHNNSNNNNNNNNNYDDCNNRNTTLNHEDRKNDEGERTASIPDNGPSATPLHRQEQVLSKEILDCHEIISRYVASLGIVVRNLKPTIAFQLRT
ncbi:hypothetical protein ACA910_003786 [Epithemia clementina (nom. ined.)]